MVLLMILKNSNINVQPQNEQQTTTCNTSNNHSVTPQYTKHNVQYAVAGDLWKRPVSKAIMNPTMNHSVKI